MALTLTDHQLQHVRELQELLVAPLRFPTPEAWVEAVHDAATDVFGVERAFMVLPLAPDEVLVHYRNFGSETVERWDPYLVGTRSESNRYSDPLLDRAMRRLAMAGVEVWNREIAERVSGFPMEAMPRYYPEVIRPARLERMLVMGASLTEGRALFAVFPDGDRSTAFGEDEVEVFRLLSPAFRAGSRARALASHRWRRLRDSLDLLEEGVAVYRSGAERYRNRALRRLLGADEEREKLIAAIARCADDLVRWLEGSTPLESPPDISAEVTTAENRYRLAASHLEGGSVGEPTRALVVVRPAVPALPDDGELRHRYRLTPRQAEVALLLAEGRSNREIAEELAISQHTARHHAQRVLEKVGADSRKALAIHLLSDRAR